MSSYCSLHRLPRAGIDPISSEQLALSMITLAMAEPLRHETIVLLLDHERRGLGILVVSGTVPFDAMFDVLDVVVDLDIDELGAIVLASVRPPGAGDDPTDAGTGLPDLDAHDVDRWLEASSMLDARGLEFLEWFVVGAGACCPRDLVGVPPRW